MLNIKEHWLEIILGISGIAIALVTSFFVSKDTAIILGVLSAVIAIAIAIIRIVITNAVLGHDSDMLHIAASNREVVEIMAEMDGISLKYAKRHLAEFLTRIHEIHSGKIFMTMPEYFNTLLACLSQHQEGDVIYAINSKGGLRWKTDPRQEIYKRANFAAADKGVKINRVFIVNKQDIETESFHELRSVIKEHLAKKNIKVYLVIKEVLDNIGVVHDCDWVYIERPYRKVLVDYVDASDPLRGSHAYMLTEDEAIEEKIDYFNEIVRLAESQEALAKILG